MTPQLAVICSIHNGARWMVPDAPYPFTAIESVLGQWWFSDFEFLVVDDGSTDATWTKLVRYRDPRMRVYRHPARIGLSASLREAVARTTAPLIARIDIDDACVLNRFREQIDFLEQHPEIGLLGAAAVIDGPGWESHYPPPPPATDRSIRWTLMRKNPFVHSSVMMRRSAYLAAGGYNPEIMVAQDYDLWTRMAEHTQMAILPDALVRVRRHGGQITAQKKRMIVDQSFSIVRAAIQRGQYRQWAEIPALYAWIKGRV